MLETSKVELAGLPFVGMQRKGHALLIAAFYGYLLLTLALAFLNEVPAAEWLIPALLVYVVVRLAPIIMYKSDYGWFHPLVFGAILSLVELLRYLPSYGWGLQSHPSLPEYTPEQLTRLLAYQLVLHTIGLLAYYLGFFCVPSPRVPRLTIHRPRNLSAKVIGVVAFSAITFILYVQGKGGLYSHLVSWGLTREVSLSGDFYWVLLISLGSYACLIWFSLSPKAVRQPLFWIATAISFAVIFLASGSRSSFIYIIIIALVVMILRTKRFPIMSLLVAVFAALILLSILGDLRRSTWSGRVDWSTVTQVKPVEAITRVVKDDILARRERLNGLLPILARVPNEVDLLYGDTYLASVVNFVPRKLWAGKPRLIDSQVGHRFFGISAGVPPGPIGEAYWNFHIPGVLVVFFLFGIFHRWLTTAYLKYAPMRAAMPLYAITLVLATPSGIGIVHWLLAVLPVLVLLQLFGAVSFGSQQGWEAYRVAAAQ